ncbi:hypothetical protein ADEMBY_36 [Bacillus phage Ademby]|nr:hypothetical protein ADEMBY_36 [Bacillus phage Ademby]
MERKGEQVMEKITRNDSRFLPKFSINRKVNYINDSSLSNLIKRADEMCDKYGLEYESRIYKVTELYSYDEMNNSAVRLKSGKTRYKGTKSEHKEFYEVKLIKVGA